MATDGWNNARRPELGADAKKSGWPTRVYSLSDRITPLVTDNPKHGTARGRFDIYYPGITVSDYIRKAAELRPDLNRPSRKGNPAGMLMEDISWDEGQGWIKVEKSDDANAHPTSDAGGFEVTQKSINCGLEA